MNKPASVWSGQTRHPLGAVARHEAGPQMHSADLVKSLTHAGSEIPVPMHTAAAGATTVAVTKDKGNSYAIRVLGPKLIPISRQSAHM